MSRYSLALIGALVVLLGACGGGGSTARYSPGGAATAVDPDTGAPVVLFASGPISQACLKSGRSKASRARCGCVQAVANQRLSGAEQRRGASFFDDPQMAQDIRQSDNAANEVFWKRWKAYGQDAARLCSRA